MQPGFDPEKVTLFARTNARGQNVPFGIKAKDRQRHMYVIGKTGMGKSTLLENMAAQDLTNGEGLCFIDPHGSAIEALLEYVPEERLDDVVYFAPFDMDHPISFNIMEDVGADTRHLVVSGLMSTFKKIWEDAWSARMEYILTNALLALIEYPDTTLLSVNRMLADKEYRDKVVDYVKDPAVKAYWVDEFANYTERFAAEALPAIQNKIGQFTGNPLIRNIIGQPKSSFDVRKMMDEKKILLVNLSKGLVGETNADLLGSMLITKIYLSAMSRAELPPAQMKQMPNFYFYVDEFQSFANSTFANILSEARKYHLNLIIAHQYVDQMEETVRNAVFGNVGTTVTFRVGPFDAEVLEPIFTPPFLANDLVNLGFAQIYLTLMIDGVGSVPFSATTLPPIETPAVSHREMVIARSRQNYCKPRAEIQKIVEDLHAPEERLAAAEAGEGGNNGGFTKPSGFHKVGKDKEFVNQKERLKQGLPRQKGPAQTAPGTKSPEQKSDSRSLRTGAGGVSTNGTAVKKKPSPAPQKSPDDLRAILAQMAGKNTPKSEEKSDPSTSTASSQTPATAAPAVRNQEKNRLVPEKVQPKPPAAQSEVTEPANVSAKPAVGDTQHKQELQAVLAQMTGQTHTEKIASDRQPTTSQEVSTPSKHVAAPPTELDPISQLKQRFATSKSDQPVAPQSKEPDRITAQSPQSSQLTIATEVPAPADPAPVESADPLGNRRQEPAFTAVVEPSEPDVQTVKKLLRHSGTEHPPAAPR